MAEPPSFDCPVCGARSYHPKDVAEGYCGRCHAFTGQGTEVAREEEGMGTERRWGFGPGLGAS